MPLIGRSIHRSSEPVEAAELDLVAFPDGPSSFLQSIQLPQLREADPGKDVGDEKLRIKICNAVLPPPFLVLGRGLEP